MASDFFGNAGANAVGTLMVDYLVKPVDRRIRYMFRFHNIVENFRDQKRALTTAQTQLQEDVKEAKRQNHEIEKYVEDWLDEAEKVLGDVKSTVESRIQENQKCCNCCPNWCWRYQLSKKIDQKTEAITTLVNKTSKFDRIGHRANLPGIEFLSSNDLVASKSYTSAMNEIMKALRVDQLNMIGVWGIGGVGKTTLVKEVGREAKRLNIFDRVVMAEVSQTPDIGEIQNKIADFLGLDLKKRTVEGKAEELWLRLKSEKKILIILDDICKKISLESIGIPFGQHHKGCKVVFTTTKTQICNSMESQVMVSLDVLEEQEAWNLFKMNARIDNNASPDITKEAMEVARECKGLPLAVVTVAKALRGESVNGWKLACKKIKSGRLMEIENLQDEDKKVLNSILNSI
ncbi:hypothetical protein PTKIN_Ptkin14bG0195700 [Pterospermum kingtungense]